MKIDILTLFPDMFKGVFEESIIKRAEASGLVKIDIHNFRDYSLDPHKKVDDTPYGGGAGMVLTCQPIFDAVKTLRGKDTKVILLTPSGMVYNQSLACSFSRFKHLIIICGHYEGFDERITSICDYQISIGDYVLTGGEIPSMVLVDSITRLLDGVINRESYENDSFYDNLLDYPNYTKPRVYNELEVPGVLLSGNHEEINKWRRMMQRKKTLSNRPDLIKGEDLNG